MLAGIGVDIVEIARIDRLLARFGDRVAHRMLTSGEFECFVARGRSPAFLASRFAAKEAASKALGSGIARGVGFHSLEVFNEDSGQPRLCLHDQARLMAEYNGISRWQLSLSDEKHYCIAMVVMESA